MSINENNSLPKSKFMSKKSNRNPDGSVRPAYIYAEIYAGMAIGITNSHLKTRFPGKLYITTNQADETPMIVVNNETNSVINNVLST
tara:strand:- start:185 stop:445 length:261 start_codon:yes stop_codon:yes gene_type:complete